MGSKVGDLIGERLDAAVALALDWTVEHRNGKTIWRDEGGDVRERPNPWSARWEFGGPIIEREHILIIKMRGLEGWYASCGPFDHLHFHKTKMADAEAPQFHGPTPLIAAMRAFVGLYVDS